MSLWRTSTCLRLACATSTAAASAFAESSSAATFAFANIHGGFGVVAVLRGHFALIEKLLHARKILLIARELDARLNDLRIARRDPGLRLLDRGAGLIARPRVIVICRAYLRFETGDVGPRRGEIRFELLGIEFGDQVALLYGRCLHQP